MAISASTAQSREKERHGPRPVLLPLAQLGLLSPPSHELGVELHTAGPQKEHYRAMARGQRNECGACVPFNERWGMRTETKPQTEDLVCTERTNGAVAGATKQEMSGFGGPIDSAVGETRFQGRADCATYGVGTYREAL